MKRTSATESYWKEHEGTYPRAPGPYPQVRWGLTLLAPTPTIEPQEVRWAWSPRDTGSGVFVNHPNSVLLDVSGESTL